MNAYSEMLPTLAAEQQLGRIEAATVPHMRDQARQDVVRDYLRELGRAEPARKATAGDLQAMGITVVEKKREAVKTDV